MPHSRDTEKVADFLAAAEGQDAVGILQSGGTNNWPQTNGVTSSVMANSPIAWEPLQQPLPSRTPSMANPRTLEVAEHVAKHPSRSDVVYDHGDAVPSTRGHKPTQKHDSPHFIRGNVSATIRDAGAARPDPYAEKSSNGAALDRGQFAAILDRGGFVAGRTGEGVAGKGEMYPEAEEQGEGAEADGSDGEATHPLLRQLLNWHIANLEFANAARLG